MPSYPISFPSRHPANATFGIQRSVAASTSPFTFRQQVALNQGEKWRGSVEFPPLTREQAADFQAFFLELQGMYGTFLYGDPYYLAQGPRGVASGSPLVFGGGQTGNALNVDGLGAGITGWLKKGDYFQIGTGTSARLYQVTADVNTNGSGQATINFYPALRTSPADNASVVVQDARGCFRLVSNVSDIAVVEGGFHIISFGFEEAISE